MAGCVATCQMIFMRANGLSGKMHYQSRVMESGMNETWELSEDCLLGGESKVDARQYAVGNLLHSISLLECFSF